MSRKKISTTIYVTPEQSDRLKVLHDRTKVPVAVYIREGIDLVLRQYAHLLPGQLPLVQSAQTPEEPKPRRRADSSTRELPGMESALADDDADDETASRLDAAGDANGRLDKTGLDKTGLDKVAAGAKK
jgi:hypothetical protein